MHKELASAASRILEAFWQTRRNDTFGIVWIFLGTRMHIFREKISYVWSTKIKFICEIVLEMSITFHDESNDGNYLMIDYSDATVTIL